MKRSPIKRRTPLRRKAPMRAVNADRASKRRERDFGPLADYVRGLPCASCRTPAPSDPAHVRSRGAGGHAWTDAGHGNIIPLCRRCHTKQHSQGWTALWQGGQEAAGLLARSVGEGFRVSENERDE